MAPPGIGSSAKLRPGRLPTPRQADALTLERHLDCEVACEHEPPPAPTGDRPAVAWSEVLGAKARYFDQNATMDVYGLVLRGAAVVYDRSGAREPIDVGAWSAFRAPGGDVGVAAQGGDARLVLALVAREGSVREAMGATAPWRDRPSPLETVSLAAARDLSWADGKVHARLGFEDGSASLGLLMAVPEAPVPPHVHERSWEVIGLLSVSGRMRIGEPPRDEHLDDGAVVAVPPGVRHAFSPSGTKPLFAVQMYVPPGPEQRFETMAQ